MPTKSPPLLCELHAHTTWSDGSLTVRELCDLYGRRGFDVLAVTDHAPRDARHIQAGNFAAYLAEVEAEANRARERYDLLVIPGLELTYDDPDPLQAAHVVAVGLREFVGLDDGLETALAAARSHGAALVAAHPYAPEQLAGATRTTAAFGAHPELAPLVDRFELFNRHTLFSWGAAAGHPAIAKDEAAVVGYLRSPRPAFLVRLDEAVPAEALAA